MSDRLRCASVLITHDVQESFAIADHVYLVGQGRLTVLGVPAGKKISPAEWEASVFVSLRGSAAREQVI